MKAEKALFNGTHVGTATAIKKTNCKGGEVPLNVREKVGERERARQDTDR